MRREHAVVGVLFVLLVGGVYAQRQPRRVPEQDPGYESPSENIERHLSQLKMLDIPATREKLPADVSDIYRRPTKSELAAVEPSAEITKEYAAAIQSSNAGLLKLNSSTKCLNDRGVVSADAECAKYNFPGAGTAYSFRVGAYRTPRLSDLALKGKVLMSVSVLQHGILVRLGDVRLEDLKLDSPGVAYMAGLPLAKNKETFDAIDQQLTAGIKHDGYLYRMGVVLEPNTTYALRSTAYRGSSMQNAGGRSYDEFEFDRRGDVIVVFRVVDIDPAGNPTILWRELSRNEAPKLKL